MSTFVLVAGAWLGAWAWRDVTADLRARGHDVHPLSLTGLGERAHLGGPGVTLETHVADIVDYLEKHDLREVILVGHSYAGACPVPVAVHRAGDRLSHVVYVDCAPLGHGDSMLGEFGAESAERMRAEVAAGDGWGLPFPGAANLATEKLREGLTGEALAALDEGAVPHPFGTWTEPLELSGPAIGDPARVMVACNDVLALLDSGNRWMTELIGPDWRRYDLPTGHWPMFSAPGDLADVLDLVSH